MDVDNEGSRRDMWRCQTYLHRWGNANQVIFDPTKEITHILSAVNKQAEGVDFRILGVEFDCQLRMSSCVDELVHECSWKLRTIMRTRKFFSCADLVSFFKSHILSFLEYRTAALYHACDSTLHKLDSILSGFLREICVNDLDALHVFNLAPLKCRRDIAMLGLLHRSAIGQGPRHFAQWFCQAPERQKRTRLHLARQILGMLSAIRIWLDRCVQYVTRRYHYG